MIFIHSNRNPFSNLNEIAKRPKGNYVVKFEDDHFKIKNVSLIELIGTTIKQFFIPHHCRQFTGRVIKIAYMTLLEEAICKGQITAKNIEIILNSAKHIGLIPHATEISGSVRNHSNFEHQYLSQLVFEIMHTQKHTTQIYFNILKQYTPYIKSKLSKQVAHVFYARLKNFPNNNKELLKPPIQDFPPNLETLEPPQLVEKKQKIADKILEKGEEINFGEVRGLDKELPEVANELNQKKPTSINAQIAWKILGITGLVMSGVGAYLWNKSKVRFANLENKDIGNIYNHIVLGEKHSDINAISQNLQLMDDIFYWDKNKISFLSPQQLNFILDLSDPNMIPESLIGGVTDEQFKQLNFERLDNGLLSEILFWNRQKIPLLSSTQIDVILSRPNLNVISGIWWYLTEEQFKQINFTELNSQLVNEILLWNHKKISLLPGPQLQTIESFTGIMSRLIALYPG